MVKKQKFYQISTSGRVADINIYGDITSWPWLDSDVSAYGIKEEIDALDVDDINVYINSYGGEVAEALAILEFTPRAASPIVEKVLRSAIANAEHNYDLESANLYVSEAYVNEGATLKRFRPRAKGMASPINKRTSHVVVVVSEKND